MYNCTIPCTFSVFKTIITHSAFIKNHIYRTQLLSDSAISLIFQKKMQILEAPRPNYNYGRSSRKKTRRKVSDLSLYEVNNTKYLL